MASGVTGWLLHKFTDINRERMNEHINIMQKNTGHSKPYIYGALMWSFLTRGTGYTDFFRGNFLSITSKEKDTFVTAKSFYQILAYLNNPQYIVAVDDKLVFNEMFRDYLGRDFVNLRVTDKTQFAEFLRDKESVFAKNPSGQSGHGIKKIVLSEVSSTDTLYDELTENKLYLVEEPIIQSEELSKINPHAVSSFRIITLYKDGEAHIINNALRVNRDESNIIGCTNDLYCSLGEDGKINSNVIDDYGNVYEAHPLTGTKFSNVKISGVKQAFEMCKVAAKKVPQLRYIGWDVAFTVTGPILVEANDYPGYGLFQHYKLKGKRTGHLKEIADVLGDEMKHIKL